MEVFKYCTACLAVDVKMYNFNSLSIGEIYSQLAELPVTDEPQHVCFECAGLLHKYHKFRSKCHRAHSLLSRIKDDMKQITKKDIQNINRKQNQLESSLTFSPIATSSKEPTNGTEKDEINELIHLPDNLEIKNENETSDAEVFDTNINDTIHDESSNDCLINLLKITKTKRKSKTIKEPKTKKRRVQKEISQSDDNLSDDEPLSKCITSKEKKVKKKNGLNISYFEDYATVTFLTPEDARREVLLRKESTNYKKSPFKCGKCFRGYEAKAAFENHMKKHSIEYGEYECDLCQLRFPQQIYLCKHRLSCHKRKFICKLCPYVCYCTYQAKTHVSLHKGKKYPCNDCGEIFSMPNSLLMHKRMKHLKESVRESVCEHCGSTFGTPRGLFLHTMKVHRQDKNDKLGPECKECGVHFTSEAAWKRHLVLSTKHKVSNGCKSCGETFSNTEDLKAHMRVHSRKHSNRCDSFKPPAACAICDKWLVNRVEYKSHVTSEHPLSDEANKFKAEDNTPFVCEVCGQMFKQQCFLTYHQRKHTGERPYACAQCGKAFQLAGALAVHRAVHARARRHHCHLCGRVFTFKSALNKHIKVHLGIRPHKCAICDKGFIHMCDLRLHIKYVHDKVPWPKKKTKRNAAQENAPFLEYN